MPLNQFALLLKKERLRRKWSQQEVAERLKTTRVTIARWELGQTLPALYLRDPLCKLFGQRIEDFFSFEPLTTQSSAGPSVVKTGVNAADTRHVDIITTNETDIQFDPGELAHEGSDLLATEMRHLDIQMARLELQRKRIAYTIETANQLINVFDPACPGDLRSLVIESLLADLDQSGGTNEQEITLPTFQSVRKALEDAMRTKTQNAVHLELPRPSSSREARRMESGDAPLQSEVSPTFPSGTGVDGLSLSVYKNECENRASTPPIGTTLRPIPDNPYGYLTPIRDSHRFIGRVQTIRLLYSALVQKQSISLVGLRHIGKTSLLYYITTKEAQYKFGREDELQRHLFILKDMSEFLRGSDEDFFNVVNAELVSRLRDLTGLETPLKATGAIGFQNLLDQIRENGFYPVLLLDEFDKITANPQFDDTFFSFLRTMANSGRISYIVASQTHLHQIIQGNVVGSPFFNIFFLCGLGPLNMEEARELITKPAEEVNLPFNEQEIRWILEAAGCHPFFIQQICYYLLDAKLYKNDIPLDTQQVKDTAYRDLLPHFQDIWERLLEWEQKKVRAEILSRESSLRYLPELSESSFFRRFIHRTFQNRFKLTIEELEDTLEKIDDSRELGSSNFAIFANVLQRIPPDASVVQKGIVIRDVLKEAHERMRGSGVRTDNGFDWRLYNMLYYRYFKHHLKHEHIATRLQFNSTRQYFRERGKALEALLNVLLEMEEELSQNFT